MWIRSTLISLLFSSISPAFAAYSEQWLSEADIAKAQGRPAQNAHAKTKQAKETTAPPHLNDDPIAAFAHADPSTKHSKSSTTRSE
jgi:hypothetical protein